MLARACKLTVRTCAPLCQGRGREAAQRVRQNSCERVWCALSTSALVSARTVVGHRQPSTATLRTTRLVLSLFFSFSFFVARARRLKLLLKAKVTFETSFCDCSYLLRSCQREGSTSAGHVDTGTLRDCPADGVGIHKELENAEIWRKRWAASNFGGE